MIIVHEAPVINRKDEFITTIIIMTIASLSVIFPLIIFKNLIVVFVLYYLIICMAVPMIDLLIYKKMSFKDSLNYLGFSNLNIKKSVLIGFVHGIIFFSITLIGFFIFKDTFISSDVVKSLVSWGIANSDKWIIFLLMVMFNGIIEEVFWRGYTFGKLNQVSGQWLKILLVTAFYTSYHLATILTFFHLSLISIQMILAVFIAGALWGWMRGKYGNTWASTIGHALATLGYMVVYLLI